jgi:prolyl oligopeptidase
MGRLYGGALFAALLIASCGVAAQDRVKPINWPAPPPLAAQRPVVETFFGTTLTDPYRYMETPGDSETLAWMNAQAAFARSILDAIPARAAFLHRLDEFSGAFGMISDYTEAGGRAFYLERLARAEVSDLMVREPDGRTRKLVDVAALLSATGRPHAVDYFTPSQDGTRIAVGVAVGGSEQADLAVLDVATGNRIAGPLVNARYYANSFGGDERLAFQQFQELSAGQPRSDSFLNQRTLVWDLKTDPVVVAGATTGAGPPMRATEAAELLFPRGSTHALLSISDGVAQELRLYVANAADVGRDMRWRLLVDRDAGVTSFYVRQQTIYLLSHRDAPTFKVLRMSLDDEAARPETVIASRRERPLERIVAAADALYAVAREGLYATLLRVPSGDGMLEEIALPINGTVSQLWADPLRPGIVVAAENWTTPRTYYRFVPDARRFAALPSGARPALDAGRYVTHDLNARAKDGVEIPLSVVAATGPRLAKPLILRAYGSYGDAYLPGFDAAALASIDAGATRAVCHVRGGGEMGEAWRLAGKDANKPNTWRDLIACAERLIADGFTSSDMLMIAGSSAGGIAVGRAKIERPDLFAAVLSDVPMASAIRAEFQLNGPVNIVEFGTIKDPTGFKNLLAMDAYFSVEAGTAYPAVLFTTGLNDPRVDPWQPAKAAARMQTAGSPNPVLLRVAGDGGHGIGATRRQEDEKDADTMAFLFWRAGLPNWQPVPPR